jgi:hypothetical protein
MEVSVIAGHAGGPRAQFLAMKTREQKEQERREREAAWAAEDSALNAAASQDVGVEDVLGQAEDAWQTGRSFFVLEAMLGANTFAWLPSIRSGRTTAWPSCSKLLRRLAGV